MKTYPATYILVDKKISFSVYITFASRCVRKPVVNSKGSWFLSSERSKSNRGWFFRTQNVKPKEMQRQNTIYIYVYRYRLFTRFSSLFARLPLPRGIVLSEITVRQIYDKPLSITARINLNQLRGIFFRWLTGDHWVEQRREKRKREEEEEKEEKEEEDAARGRRFCSGLAVPNWNEMAESQKEIHSLIDHSSSSTLASTSSSPSAYGGMSRTTKRFRVTSRNFRP